MEALLSDEDAAAYKAWADAFNYVRALRDAFNAVAAEDKRIVGTPAYKGNEAAYREARQISAEHNLKRYQVRSLPGPFPNTFRVLC